MMEQHFVTFFSPGTFFAEQTTLPIDSWDVEQAKQMAATVTERYNAKPYAFQFSTRSRSDSELDSSVSAKSKMYFINCRIRTVAEVEANSDPKEQTLLANMKGNGWGAIAQTITGWKWSQPFEEGDVLLTEDGQVITAGAEGAVRLAESARTLAGCLSDATTTEQRR
jgi:hypothetical protein